MIHRVVDFARPPIRNRAYLPRSAYLLAWWLGFVGTLALVTWALETVAQWVWGY